MTEKISYEMILEDVISFGLYHTWDAPNRKGFRIKTLSLIPLILSIILLVFFVFSGEQSIGQLFGLLLMIGFIFFATFIMGNGSTRKKVEANLRKFYSAGRNLNYNGKMCIEFQDQYVIHKTQYYDSKIKWEVFEKYCLTEDHIYIYDSAVSAIIIPKQYVDSEQIDRIIALLKEKITVANK